jgi:putative acetyltransferase
MSGRLRSISRAAERSPRSTASNSRGTVTPSTYAFSFGPAIEAVAASKCKLGVVERECGFIRAAVIGANIGAGSGFTPAKRVEELLRLPPELIQIRPGAEFFVNHNDLLSCAQYALDRAEKSSLHDGNCNNSGGLSPFRGHGGARRAKNKLAHCRIMLVLIRTERGDDRGAIYGVNQTAFGGREESELIDRLREEGSVLLSLVAEIEGRVVGHVLFSRMFIDAEPELIPAVALAPMAVLPANQRQGIGGELIRAGLDAMRAQGERIVIVVGHPEYYPRFGFSATRAAPLESPFPPEAFMALELAPGALDEVRGKVRYASPFGI